MSKFYKKLGIIFVMAFAIMLGRFSSVLAADDLGKWETKASNPEARYYFGSTTLNNKIYTVGGFYWNSGTIYLNSLQEYNITEDKWITKKSMPTFRAELGFVTVNNKLYAIGGVYGTALKTVEEYDPATDTWITKKDMPTARYNIATSVINNKIYVIGGIGTEKTELKTVEEYDPATDTWTTKKDMPTARATSAASVNGKIYVVGGRLSDLTALKTVEEYNPATDTWVTKKDMSTARETSVTSLGGKVYAIGGSNILRESVCSPVNIVEAYDPVTNTWSNLNSMPTPRYGLSVVASEGGIYAIGGSKGGIYSNAVEVFTIQNNKIILNIEPEKNNIHLNETVSANLTVDNIKEIAAEDVRIKYDSTKLEFLGMDEVEGIKLVKGDPKNGELRLILASKGKANIVNDKKSLLKLKFKGIAKGEALVDITKGRVSDGIEMERDLKDEECGEAKIIIDDSVLKDVNNSGEFTLLDLAIDARHMSKDPKSTELAKYNTDIVANNAIDDADLLEIGKLMLQNTNYTF